MALNQVLHELVALLVRRLTDEDEVKATMAMLGKLLDVMRNLGAGRALGQHAVFISLIDKRYGAVRKEARPILELLRRHLDHAGFGIVEFANVAGVDDAPLILELKEARDRVKCFAVTGLAGVPVNHEPAPIVSATAFGTIKTFQARRIVSAERIMLMASPTRR